MTAQALKVVICVGVAKRESEKRPFLAGKTEARKSVKTPGKNYGSKKGITF
jgi:hypothetical protein